MNPLRTAYAAAAAVGCVALIAGGQYALSAAYRRGWEAHEAEVAKQVSAQSEKQRDALLAVFNKHTIAIMATVTNERLNREKVARILEDESYLGVCHSDDGVQLLNERIEAANRAAKAAR